MSQTRRPFQPDPDEWAQRQQITSTCAICGASTEAQVSEALKWFAGHRATEHPELPTVSRGRANPKQSR